MRVGVQLRFCGECLNGREFTSPPHAKMPIEAWRREHNEVRPKKSPGGLTPATYARQLAAKAETSTPDAKATYH
ncbi:integrase core domain-containing protein [Burkholderia glumae]|uniref:integrase core domain-containing protein n=1 Tax=Burkholderia glumae TaxID=337 RepID=UPI000C27695E|nr:hypothetical protein Y5A_022950 [Burkholderia glumae AU6208]QGA39948.1 transposase [Burkholderia glumae]